MIEEATIDAFSDSEQTTGWYTMREELLALPFETTLLGVVVKVARLDLRGDNNIVAICTRGRRGPSGAKLEQFRVVNTSLGNLKTSCSGNDHAFDFVKCAHRYLAEVQYRFNGRFDLSSILKRLLVAAVVTPPRPERFLRMAEPCG